MTPLNDRKSKQRRARWTTQYERLGWLVDFAFRADEIKSLSGEALQKLRADVGNFPTRIMTIGAPTEDLSPDRIRELAHKLRQGIHDLLRGEPWLTRIDSLKLYLAFERGTPHSRYIAGHLDGFLLEAHELIAAEGRRMRQCRRAECPKVFVARKRQIFCGPQCAQQERTDRFFLASRSNEELSAQRHRRYVEVVKRTKGAAVANKVRRRPSR